ncbi:hypothetical protein JK358_21370 [Nocardia sp. 2]|uniref:Cyclase n=1 Tax=Nocardia acididurans TaxID=2802282 RepID=A0ABS1MA83_9NOCA|nr:hypothetical protein [Nocardia acididurans]MBL1076950.1 hypothetical protein [Nocardia acididurans]
MTINLHIDNTVHDYDAWKTVFDKFDRFRSELHVRSCRVSRLHDNPARVLIGLGFDNLADAETFREALHKVTASPQSQALLVSHTVHVVEIVDEHIPGAALAG